MGTKKILAVTALAFLVLQACQNPSKKTMDTQSKVIDSAIASDVFTDTSGYSRGADMSIFFKEAALESMMELELGKIAEVKTTNKMVKRFAKKSVKDHTKLMAKLTLLAKNKKIALPAALPQKDIDHIAEVKKLPEPEFNKHYIGMMVKNHLKTLDLFKAAASSGDSPLENFAINTLRSLEAHYKEATNIQNRL